MPHAAPMTAEQLLGLDLPDKRTELVRGVLMVREPAGFRHGAVAVKLAAQLQNFVAPRDLGIVLAAETGYTLARDPDTVRAPDVSLVRKARVPDPLPRGFAEFAPDLAVEVLSPDDRPGEVLVKIGDWLNAGTALVWVVDPERRTARAYRADRSETFVATDGELNGEDVLPGFACPLRSIL